VPRRIRSRYLPLDFFASHVAREELIEVPADWRKTHGGYHLY